MLHIDLPSRAQIEKLAAYRGSPAVSIYLRTTPNTQETKADRIELKNLLKTALGELEAVDTAKRSLWPIQEGIEALVEDDAFWVTQANSLAIFATPDRVRTFRLPNKLANAVEVSDRFHIAPLIRSVTFAHEAYVLAIGVGRARLIEVSADLPPHHVPVHGMPHNFSDALGRRSHLERDSGMRSGEGTSESALLTRYARIVDQSLRAVLTGDERPLVIAAAEPMASVYKSVSSYPHVAEGVISGSADDTPDHALAEAARKVLDEVYAGQIHDFGALYAAREVQGRATTDVAQAARAATFGAVDTLMVDMDSTLTGLVGEEDGAVTFDSKPDAVNYGIADEIVRRTLQAGGRVLSVRRADLPGNGDLAAILRYAI
ncbi:baeRF11 domain-containing protein [Xanthobacter sediminis]|uniref:baeRF11 domain-containing protein n=1 Tax=Xanthobacter sediminis TaxID=3119926 RepID=UPI00372A6AD9